MKVLIDLDSLVERHPWLGNFNHEDIEKMVNDVLTDALNCSDGAVGEWREVSSLLDEIQTPEEIDCALKVLGALPVGVDNG